MMTLKKRSLIVMALPLLKYKKDTFWGVKTIYDFFLIFSVFTLITAGMYLPSAFISIFGSHPKAYRLAVTFIATGAVCVSAVIDLRDELSQRSFIFTCLKKHQQNPIYWVLFFFLILASGLSVSSYYRHHVFLSSFDFAIFAQAIWNTWQGDWFYSSIKGGINLLGDHVSPIMAFFAPLYGIWENPAVLLIAQALVVSSSVFPIYFIGKVALRDKYMPLVFVLAFVCFTPMRNAARFDFHPELIGDPLMLWAFYFIIRNKLVHTSTFLFFVALTKETACAPIAALGLYCWWFQKKFQFGITWFVIAIIVFFLDVKIIAPALSGWEYAYLSGNYLEWFTKHPSELLNHIHQPSTFNYMKRVFLSVGAFSFLSPSTFFLTLPILTQNLLSRGLFTRSTYFQYTTFLTPFIFISSIYGFRNFYAWIDHFNNKRAKGLKKCAIYWLIFWSFIFVGGSEYRMSAEFIEKNTKHLNYVRRYLKEFSKSPSVRTHEFFAPHVSMRKELHIYENGHIREGGSVNAQNAKYVILDKLFLGSDHASKINKLLKRGYALEHEHDGFYVLKRKNN